MLKHSNNTLLPDFSQPFASMYEGLHRIVFLQRSDGASSTSVRAVFRCDGFSSVEFENNFHNIQSIGFAPLFSGNYCFRRKVSDQTFFDFYDATGKFLSTQTEFNATPLYVDTIQMEPHSVFIDHLYNILCFEYAQAKKAEANTERLNFVEQMIRQIGRDFYSERRFVNLGFDAGFQFYNQKLIETERSHVLRYSERQNLRKKILAERRTLLEVKARVHGLSWWKRIKSTFLGNVKTHLKVVQQHPSDVLKGTTYRYTIGLLIWFFSVVRNNIGYSIALAVYGPFTFYFITQPMNPHAMWAVGKVRSTYLETIDATKRELASFGLFNPKINEPAQASIAAASGSVAIDLNLPTPTTVPTVSNNVNKNESFAKYTPRFGILLSSDIKSVSTQTWPERMSQFKDMQIGYEENMQFSERMGRLEQMESQLNFPLIAESSFRETERYLQALDELLLDRRTDLTILAYAKREQTRTYQTQLYIWDRLVRFIFDHQYIMMDVSSEQKNVDYYMGRSFIFLKELTESLARRHKGLPMPKGFAEVEKLAERYASQKIEANTIEERLNKNSLLAKQKDFFSTQEMRAEIRRQWEILFLLQNKAQEAANFGMQTYTWSVRNAIWVLQSLYSNKIYELKLFNRLLTQPTATDLNELTTKVEPLYESLYHILTMEYVSIKTELGQRLGNDIESLQRKVIVENTRDFFNDRQQVVNRFFLSK